MPEFLRPCLKGRRFDDGHLPLDMLGDLSVLGEMVVEVAKWCYRQANPERERSPKGFAERTSFGLVGVLEGSAVPVIEMKSDLTALPGMPGAYDQYFFEARDAIVRSIAAAERDEEVASILPGRYLSYFDRLGSSLRDGEYIEFPTSSVEAPARLTTQSRERLVLASQNREFTHKVEVRCQIPEVDQDRMTFELQLPEGQKVRGVIHEQHHDVIMQVFNKYKERGTALIQGIGKYDQQDRLLSLVGIEEIIALNELDIPSRLDELRELEDGWLEGSGQAPNNTGLDWLAHSFQSYYPPSRQLPYAYPTPEGGIQLEWSLGTKEVSIEIDLLHHFGEWHSLDLTTDRSDVKSLNLDEPSAWNWVAEQIQRLESAAE